MEDTEKRNILKHELGKAKEVGFTVRPSVPNPYLILEDNTTVVWMAGELLSLVTTSTYFGDHQHLKNWKSSKRNEPDASMSSTQINSWGKGTHTEMYYREVCKKELKATAERLNKAIKDIDVDHINHIRGDCRDENLRPATKAQNNRNRSKTTVEKAFFTLDELQTKLASGEWKILKEEL